MKITVVQGRCWLTLKDEILLLPRYKCNVAINSFFSHLSICALIKSLI